MASPGGAGAKDEEHRPWTTEPQEEVPGDELEKELSGIARA